MVNVTIRDLPDDVHACLRARAAASGKSLQQELLAGSISLDRFRASAGGLGDLPIIRFPAAPRRSAASAPWCVTATLPSFRWR